MQSYIHFLDDLLHAAQFPLIGLALAAWVIALVITVRAWRAGTLRFRAMPKLYFGVIGVFLAVIGLEIFSINAIKWLALAEIRKVLAAPLVSLEINGRHAAETGSLMAALTSMSNPFGHHSHPTHRIALQITTSEGALLLNLGRDSGDPHEYWVFYPKYHATAVNDVGHAFTAALDSY